MLVTQDFSHQQHHVVHVDDVVIVQVAVAFDEEVHGFEQGDVHGGHHVYDVQLTIAVDIAGEGGVVDYLYARGRCGALRGQQIGMGGAGGC